MKWGVAKPFTRTSNRLLPDMGWGGGWGRGGGKTVHWDFKDVAHLTWVGLGWGGVLQNRSPGLHADLT